MAIDRSQPTTRILVSSHDRRSWTPHGEIYALDPHSGSSRILAREGEPAGFVLRPHGMDIRPVAGGDELYVISHGEEMDDANHSIVVYRIEPDKLIFVKQLKSELLNSPNDLSVAADGSLYVTNDAASRGSMLEAILRLKRANVIYYDGRDQWRVAAAELAFPNGILIDGDTLYVSTTREDSLYAFPRQADGSLGQRRLVASFKGQDNIMRDGDWLYTAAHLSDLGFMRHRSDESVPSPSVIYRVNRRSGAVEAVFADDGNGVSAVATGLVLDGKLYVSPVFQPFVYACRLPATFQQ